MNITYFLSDFSIAGMKGYGIKLFLLNSDIFICSITTIIELLVFSLLTVMYEEWVWDLVFFLKHLFLLCLCNWGSSRAAVAPVHSLHNPTRSGSES